MQIPRPSDEQAGPRLPLWLLLSDLFSLTCIEGELSVRGVV